MSNYKFAILGFFAFIVGIILLFNVGAFLPQTTCGITLTGWVLYPVIVYEIVTGLLVLGGIILFFANISTGESLSKVITGIVVVIIIVLLGGGIISSIGTFSGRSILGAACIGASGFLCQNPIYASTTGNIYVTVGQNTGTSWDTVNFVFVSQGTQSYGGLPVVNFNSSTDGGAAYALPNGLVSGQSLEVTLPATRPVSVCVPATGAIWVQYTTQPGGQVQYAQIASVNVKAGGGSPPTTSTSTSTSTISTTSTSSSSTSTSSLSTTSTSSTSTSTIIPSITIQSAQEIIFRNYTFNISGPTPIINRSSRIYYQQYQMANATFVYAFTLPYSGYLVFNATSTHANAPYTCPWPVYLSQERPDIVNGPLFVAAFNGFNATIESLCPVQDNTYYIPVKNGTTYMTITNENVSNSIRIDMNLKYVG